MRPEQHHARVECPEVERWSAPDVMASESETSRFLASLVALLKPDLVVETGTYHGDTAESIAWALLREGRGSLLTLEVDEDCAKRATDRLRAMSLPGFVLHQTALSWTPPAPIDLLFLDTELTQRPDEARHFAPFASPRCTIVVHDTQDATLRQALDALTTEGVTEPWVYLPTPRGIGMSRYTGKTTVSRVVPLAATPGTVAYLGRQNLPFFFAGQILGLDIPPGSARMGVEGSDVALSRNRSVKRMLEFKDHRWLLFVDDDMLFDDDAAHRLLLHDQPVVSGLALARRVPHIPCVYPITEEQMASGALVAVEEAGTGFLLIRRDVLETLKEPWFEAGQIESGEMREDKHFCQKVRKAGFPIFVDTSLKIGHRIEAWVRQGPQGPQILTM